MNNVAKLKHKFKAKPQLIDGIHFASKKESKYYLELMKRQSLGDILFFLRQVPLHLPGRIRYVCDFVIFWTDGNVTFEDVKGFKTDMYKVKKKLVEHHYPIEIKEV